MWCHGFPITFIILFFLTFHENVQSQVETCQASTLQNYTCLYEHEFENSFYSLHWRFDDTNDEVSIKLESATEGYYIFTRHYNSHVVII